MDKAQRASHGTRRGFTQNPHKCSRRTRRNVHAELAEVSRRKRRGFTQNSQRFRAERAESFTQNPQRVSRRTRREFHAELAESFTQNPQNKKYKREILREKNETDMMKEKDLNTDETRE